MSISKSMTLIRFFQGIILVCVSVILMVLFNRNIKNPVWAINKAIEKITLGDLSTPVPDTSERMRSAE